MDRVGPGVTRDEIEAAYERCSGAVYTHFLQRGVPDSDAQDLTGEVFVIALRRRDTVQVHPTAGPLPWLLVTANNLLRERRRKLWRSGKAYGRLPSPPDEPDIAEAVVAREQDRWQLAVLVPLLRRLPELDQEIVQLCVLRGLAPGDVADLMGLPAGTVRSRLSRALTKLRTWYAADGRTASTEQDPR